MTWRPELHPRLPDGPGGGEFTHAEGWLHKLSSATGGSGTIPHARDRLRDKDGKRVDRFPVGRITERWAAGEETRRDRITERDDRLAAIYDIQGYHAKPTVVTESEMDHLVDQAGWRQVWRGTGGISGGSNPAKYAELFRTDDEHYPGVGIHGNGTYTSTALADAEDYTSDPIHGMLRIAIHPDARIATWGDGQIFEEYLDDNRDSTEDIQRVLADFGRYAALRGFDVIFAPGGYSPTFSLNGNTLDHYVILNRGAVAVQEAKP